MALLSLGEHAALLGRLDEAVSAGAEAVRIFVEIGDGWSEAWGTLPLARALLGLGRGSEAIGPLTSAVATFDRFKDRRSLAMAFAVLGDVQNGSGDVTAARDAWRSAAELYELLGENDLSEELRSKAAEAR